jgi:predicted RNase H-like HicB family nuclease
VKHIHHITVEETGRNSQEVIELHLDGMCEDGGPIPVPRTRVMEVEIAGSAA